MYKLKIHLNSRSVHGHLGMFDGTITTINKARSGLVHISNDTYISFIDPHYIKISDYFKKLRYKYIKDPNNTRSHEQSIFTNIIPLADRIYCSYELLSTTVECLDSRLYRV